MHYPIVFFVCLLALPVFATEPPDCKLQVACEVGNWSYHARMPDGWDGKTPLPVLLHFHGWGRQGTLTVSLERIADAANEMGVLLLGPNGYGKSWSIVRPLSISWKTGNSVIHALVM